MTLLVLVADDNLLRTTLSELPGLTGADCWLLASPRYAGLLTPAHRATYSRVVVQDHFDEKALIDRMEAELFSFGAGDDVLFMTNDEGCELAVAALQGRFGFTPWPTERILPFVNKMVSKARLAGSGVRLPKVVDFDRARLATDARRFCEEVAGQLGFPIIAKPVDRAASIDVSRLENLAQLRSWAAWASSPKDRNTYELDEFVDGDLYNCDSLIQDGEIVWSNVCRNVNPCLDFTAGKTIGAYTIPVDDPVATRVREENARILAVLDPPDGAVHLEIFRNRADELVFLEVAARPVGGDLRRVYLRAFGFDIDLTHFLLRAGLSVPVPASEPRCYGGWFVHPRRAGTVTRVDPPVFASESDLRLHVTARDVIERPSRSVVDPPSLEVVLFHEDFTQFDRDVETLRDLTLYQVEA